MSKVDFKIWVMRWEVQEWKALQALGITTSKVGWKEPILQI